MNIQAETNPFLYKFYVQITIQSIEKDGEEYINKLMNYYSKYDFKIINGRYERKSITTSRCGGFNPYHLDVIKVKINLEKEVYNIHSPSDYIKNRLHREIYDIFECFRKEVVPNDEKLDYVTWINESWSEIKSDNIQENYIDDLVDGE